MSQAVPPVVSIVALCCTVVLAGDATPGKRPALVVAGTQAGQVLDANSLQMTLVWIPPGKFRMGSLNDEAERGRDEGPVDVTLTKGFWMGSYEVTQLDWKSIMQSSPWSERRRAKDGDDYPATYVSWRDAMQFCQKLTEIERRAGRLPASWSYTLPTEAQWEYACRAGAATSFTFGDDRATLAEYAWFRNAAGASESHPGKVELKTPNAFGLTDMHGNVSEWCRDIYTPKLPGGNDPEVVPARPSFEIGVGQTVKPGATLREQKILARVRRGGSWNGMARQCRSASRASRAPDIRDDDVGFRVVLEQTGK